MGWNTLDDMDLSGKRVLVRVDINVPIVDGVVTDSTRIRRIAPTVRDILDAGGKPILLAHFGRPGGERRENLSLNQLIPTLERAFETRVLFAADCIGPGAEADTVRGKEKCCFWRTPASMRPKPRTTPNWPQAWRVWAMSIATMPSQPPTAHTARPRVSPAFCPPAQAA